jgi:hypothetical protein
MAPPPSIRKLTSPRSTVKYSSMAGRTCSPVTIAFPPTRALYEQDFATFRAQLEAEAFEAFWE